MTHRFVYEARVEFDSATDWYEARQPGLGDDFIVAVYDTVQLIVSQPHGFAPMARVPAGHEVRFLAVDRFDYLVVYQVLPGEVLILSVEHAHSNRRSWRGRLN